MPITIARPTDIRPHLMNINHRWSLSDIDIHRMWIIIDASNPVLSASQPHGSGTPCLSAFAKPSRFLLLNAILRLTFSSQFTPPPSDAPSNAPWFFNRLRRYVSFVLTYILRVTRIFLAGTDWDGDEFVFSCRASLWPSPCDKPAEDNNGLTSRCDHGWKKPKFLNTKIDF